MEKEQPVQPEFVEFINKIGRAINKFLNPNPNEKKYGFSILMFKFGEPNQFDRMNYLSNANREDMIASMKEFIARNEGTYIDPTKRKQ